MIDDVLAGDVRFPTPGRNETADWFYGHVRPHVADAHVVVADNVCAMWAGSERDVWEPESFPNSTPPFRRLWVEYRYPEQMRHNSGRITTRTGLRDSGVLILSDRIDSGWNCEAWHFIRETGSRDPYFQGLVRQYEVGNAGGIVRRPDRPAAFAMTGNQELLEVIKRQAREQTKRPVDEEIDIAVWPAHLDPTLLAVSFMNCRNVTLVEKRWPPKLAAKHRRRTGRDLHRYYVLDIQPMRRVLESEGRIGDGDLRRALHLCRGRFKDYRESGLFGRHKGVYWWEAHARGESEHGIVAKDYELRP